MWNEVEEFRAHRQMCPHCFRVGAIWVLEGFGVEWQCPKHALIVARKGEDWWFSTEGVAFCNAPVLSSTLGDSWSFLPSQACLKTNRDKLFTEKMLKWNWLKVETAFTSLSAS